ncbi:uncharacterized protein LOC134844196 isoform X2 [Symsagittifera roscoffensis]|uniref:uncharacterized protein LOC134844196 isoform X2 n=1 Tax=Symsagittifera roscoffensis TaxID=84072 RepID=UPI00307B45C2
MDLSHRTSDQFQNGKNQRLPNLYDQVNLASQVPPNSSSATTLLSQNGTPMSTVPLPPRPILGGSMAGNSISSTGFTHPALASLSHQASLAMMDLTPNTIPKNMGQAAGLGHHAGFPGGNIHHNALAAMTANLNPSAAAAMLFNPMLFQQNLNGMTNGNNNPTGSLPAIFAGGVSGIPSADDRVKLATLQNHLFYLQHQQRQQQANLLASATTSIVSEKQDEVSPTIRKTPEASEELPGGKTSPYETPHLGLKRTLDSSHSCEIIHPSDAECQRKNKEAKISPKLSESGSFGKNDTSLLSPEASASGEQNYASQTPAITKSPGLASDNNFVEVISLKNHKEKIECPLCKEDIEKRNVSGHLMEEFQILQKKFLRNKNGRSEQTTSQISEERLQTFSRIRSNRQERISCLAGKLRHFKHSYPSMIGVATDSKTSTRNSTAPGKTSPREISSSQLSSRATPVSFMKEEAEDIPLSSPLMSPSSVIRNSLDHFDKFSTPKNQFDKDLSPNGNKRLLLIESILSSDSNFNGLQKESETKFTEATSSEISPKIPSPAGSFQEQYTRDNDVIEGSFKRLTSSANEIQVR